jgi:hypothetical protein
MFEIWLPKNLISAPAPHNKLISISISICIAISLFVYLPTYLSTNLPIYLSIYLPIYPSIYPPVHLSIYPPIHPSMHPSIHVILCNFNPSLSYLILSHPISSYLILSYPIYPSISLSVCLSSELASYLHHISCDRLLSYSLSYQTVSYPILSHLILSCFMNLQYLYCAIPILCNTKAQFCEVDLGRWPCKQSCKSDRRSFSSSLGRS